MTASKWILGSLAASLLVLPINSGFAKPEKPGPDYEWEKHHTTPEGHYVPGRWTRKKKADAPGGGASPYKATPKPGAYWTPPPYNAGQAPVAPQTYVRQTYVPDPTAALVAPLAGLYLYHTLWPSYSWRYRTYTHPYAYDHTPYYTPHAWIPGKPVDPHRWVDPKHYGPVRVPHGKGYHKGPYRAKFNPTHKGHKGLPGKSIKTLAGKSSKGIPLSKAIAPGLKGGKVDAGKKK